MVMGKAGEKRRGKVAKSGALEEGARPNMTHHVMIGQNKVASLAFLSVQHELRDMHAYATVQ
jgi:hypothetical protein